MQDLKILIVEDDLLLADRLAELLLEFGYVITDTVHNSTDALRAFRKRLPDLVLMDINLEASKQDGIELAREFNKIVKVPIIFLTGIGGQETAKRAQAVKPANYLMKPYNKRQLEIAIDLAISNFVQESMVSIEHSMSYTSSPPCLLYSSKDFFFVKDNQRYVRIEALDVLWVEGLGTNVKIITEQHTLVLSANLGSFMEQVNHTSLMRVHRSYILNLQKVAAFDSGRAFVIYKGNQKAIPISKTYRETVFKRLPKLSSD